MTLLMLLLLSFVMMPAYRCEARFLQSHSLEFHTAEGETFTEIIAVTDTGEMIITEDENAVFYDFEKVVVAFKLADSTDCYVSLLDTEASKEHFSENDFQQGDEHEVNVKNVHNNVDRSANVSVETLPEAAQDICANRNLYRTTGSPRISKRGDDEMVALNDCFNMCLSYHDCDYICFY